MELERKVATEKNILRLLALSVPTKSHWVLSKDKCELVIKRESSLKHILLYLVGAAVGPFHLSKLITCKDYKQGTVNTITQPV